jgi:hypothetical protein
MQAEEQRANAHIVADGLWAGLPDIAAKPSSLITTVPFGSVRIEQISTPAFFTARIGRETPSALNATARRPINALHCFFCGQGEMVRVLSCTNVQDCSKTSA